MSVYVGKDVDIVIQSPVEEDVSSQADGTATVFTVSKTPISDRDMDGVADEPTHVTVYVDGSEVTVNAVDDSRGEVTLASAPPQGSRVIIEYRYDLNPEIAQEISLEPRQAIEGIDGLGSNKVQEWALLLKEFRGSIKEAFRKTEQFSRLTKKKLGSKYSQQFWTAAALNDFEGDTGNYSVDNQELLVTSDLTSKIRVKTSVLAKFKDGILRCKIKRGSTGDAGWILRYVDDSNYYKVQLNGSNQLEIRRIKATVDTLLFQSAALSLTGFVPVEIKISGNTKIVVDVDGNVFSVTDSDDPITSEGQVGFHGYYATNDRFDDFQVWAEISLDEYGLILDYTRGANTVKIGLDGVVFPEGSIPSPKNAPVFITSAFRARKIKFIT
ncbi:MAG: hypothetical protein ACE5NN_01060 [Candidatus Bathyarchaeia archaeon]